MGRKYPRKHTSSHNKALVISIRTFSVPSYQGLYREWLKLERLIIIIIIIFSYFVRDFPTGNVAFLLGTLNETLCERETKQATRPGDKMEAAHSTCRHQDTQWNGNHTGSGRQARQEQL